MSTNAFIMAIVILGLALLCAVAVIVVLFILLREAYREISSYYVPVSLPEITWRWKEVAADGSARVAESEV